MGKEISIKFNPKTREYEMFNKNDNSKILASFPDYQSVMEYYKEHIQDRGKRKNEN